MPSRPQRPCRATGCPALTDSGWCEAHKTQSTASAKHHDAQRGSASARGYDSAWRRHRLVYLARHPLCNDCLAAGRVVVATDVHHVIKLRERPDLKTVESNLMALCSPCHDTRTARGE